MKRGGSLKRRTTLLRTEPLPTSRKTRRTQARRSTDFTPQAKTAMKRRANGRCEWHEGCRERDLDNAHREKRSVSNGHASNGVRLCRRHHEYTHAHPREARDLGLILDTGTDYRQAPVRIRQCPVPVLLDDAGGWSAA